MTSLVYTEPEEAKSSQSAVEENNTTASKISNGPATDLLQHSSQLAELTNMSSVLDLLSQAAQSSLDEKERQVRCISSIWFYI